MMTANQARWGRPPDAMKNCGRSLLALTILVATAPGLAQDSASERQAVLATVDALYAAITNRNRDALSAITIPGSLNFSIADPVTGPADFMIINYQQLLNNLSQDGPQMSGEYRDAVVLTEGNIAAFWAHYDFYIEGQWDHCGVDSFQLVKRDGQWLVSNISSTRKVTGCRPRN